jgi:mono/diheme cytochrome c family protein
MDMDWQNDEFENLLRKFRLREPRPLAPEQPAGTRLYRMKIAAAAALVVAIGASAAIVQRLTVKDVAVVEQPTEVPSTLVNEASIAATDSVTSTSIPPVPQPKTPSIKLDPKAQDPLTQLTMVVPAPPQDAGPLSKQDPPQQTGQEEDKGHRAFTAACGSCHAAAAVDTSHFETRQEYVVLVDRMVSLGAAVSPQEAAAIVDYIFKTYGKPAGGTGDRGKSVFSVACGTCHALDVVDGRKGADKETYRSIVNSMIGYGAGVAPDQVDSLVEYLFRTYGANKKN